MLAYVRVADRTLIAVILKLGLTAAKRTYCPFFVGIDHSPEQDLLNTSEGIHVQYTEIQIVSAVRVGAAEKIFVL